VARAQSDISNAAVRIFLQEMGSVYDEKRGFHPYRTKDFAKVKDFFGNRCCYCGSNTGAAYLFKD